jgi:transcriptional regulator with XRE-family HTH domain
MGRSVQNSRHVQWRQQQFGARLGALRDAAGLQQNELAERCGCSAACVNAIEAGRQAPSLFLAGRFAVALGVLLDDLVEGLTS